LAVLVDRTPNDGHNQSARMTGLEWVTHREAAEQLSGVHISLIPKLPHRGDLTSMRVRLSLSRDRVLAVAAAPEDAERQRAQRLSESQGMQRPRPPDEAQQSMPLPAAAVVLGGRATSPRVCWQEVLEKTRSRVVGRGGGQPRRGLSVRGPGRAAGVSVPTGPARPLRC
jgi:hypothetical protein